MCRKYQIYIFERKGFYLYADVGLITRQFVHREFCISFTITTQMFALHGYTNHDALYRESISTAQEWEGEGLCSGVSNLRVH